MVRLLRAWRMAALALAALLLAGCHAQPAGKTTLEFWTVGQEGDAVRTLLPEFERRHPDIRVRVQQIPLTSAHAKLLTAFAGGSLPDLAQIGNTWIAEFAMLHALQPLDADVAASKVVRRDDYFPSAWSANEIGGRLYGIPWYVDTRLLFYRSDLLREAGFDAPPSDWAQWLRQMDAIRSQSGGKRHGVLLPVNEYDQLLALALQQHVPLLRDDGRHGNFDSPGFRRALAFYLDIFRRGDAPDVTNIEVSNPWQALGRGEFVFYLSGPWNIGEFRRRLPQSQQQDWATAPLPGPDGPGDSVAYGSSLVVPRGSRHPRAAWALIEYLSEPAVQARFFAAIGDLPPRRSTWADPALERDPKLHAFREQLERMRPVPKVPEWEQIVTAMQDVAALAVAGRLDVDQAAAEINARADAILAKRRWVLARQAREGRRP